MDQHSSPVEQATLARFLAEGFFLSHVKRIRRLYAHRRLSFIDEFERSMGKYARLQVQEAGLRFVAWLRRDVDLDAMGRAGAAVGIIPIPLSFFILKAKLAPALVFGFAAWTTTQIRKGLAEFGRAMEAPPSQQSWNR